MMSCSQSRCFVLTRWITTTSALKLLMLLSQSFTQSSKDNTIMPPVPSGCECQTCAAGFVGMLALKRTMVLRRVIRSTRFRQISFGLSSRSGDFARHLQQPPLGAMILRGRQCGIVVARAAAVLVLMLAEVIALLAQQSLLHLFRIVQTAVVLLAQVMAPFVSLGTAPQQTEEFRRWCRLSCQEGCAA